ncbi:MAG: transcription-repair coupling factor, partial [Eubacteriales bacterium]|nr:transcription-repair coupling factor [Eubacteriales bacterium]
SGFKIAMRDLEIRGAGNILGPEQHGHIATVGYDTYCRLLDDAVRQLKGEPEKQVETEISIDLNISAYIDNSYIRNEGLKIEMYKKIASIENEDDAADIKDELLDRYGDIPAETQNLIEVAYIKAIARSLGIISTSQKGGVVLFGLRGVSPQMIRALSELSATKYKRRILLNAGSKPYFSYKLEKDGKGGILGNVKILLHDVKSFEVL